MPLKREVREQVYAKCDGHCAYCGREITFAQMQVDHVCSQMTYTYTRPDLLPKYDRHDLRNLLPACARCNRWKSTHTLEVFRREISLQIERLNNYSANYRLAKDYGLVAENVTEVKFYFEHRALGLDNA